MSSYCILDFNSYYADYSSSSSKSNYRSYENKSFIRTNYSSNNYHYENKLINCGNYSSNMSSSYSYNNFINQSNNIIASQFKSM